MSDAATTDAATTDAATTDAVNRRARLRAIHNGAGRHETVPPHRRLSVAVPDPSCLHCRKFGRNGGACAGRQTGRPAADVRRRCEWLGCHHYFDAMDREIAARSDQ